MANRVLLAYNASYEFPEEVASGDNLDARTGKLINLGAATSSGDAISYGQSGAVLAGLALTAVLAMGGNKITNLADGTVASDAVNYGQLSSVTTGSRAWREVLLVKQQVLNGSSGGVRAAQAAYIATNPTDLDTFVISDGTNVETFTFKTVPLGAFDVQIGGSASATQTNLVAEINLSSVFWSSVSTNGLDDYFAANPTAQFVVYRKTTEAAVTDRLYGTLTAPSGIKVVDFFTAGPQAYGVESSTEANLPSADPAAQRFGFSRQFVLLATCETHLIANDVTTWTWNADTSVQTWYESDQMALSFTSGLTRTGSTVSVNTATAFGTYIDGGSNNVAVAITATNPGISILADGLQTLQDGSGGLAHGASGDKVKVDTVTSGNPTLAIGANGLRVIGLPSLFNINSVAVSANVTAANLGTLTAGATSDAGALHSHSAGPRFSAVTVGALAAGDPIYWSSTNNQVDKAQANTDTKSFVIGLNDSSAVSSSGTANVISHGKNPGVLAGATAGTPYYLASAGGLTTTAPGATNRVIQVGVAYNATDLWVRVLDFGKKV